jgi:glycosyltransferase involved in cell wall biosynthesis
VRTLVYAQNWIFFLNNLPEGVAWRQLPLEYLAVSRPVAWFMREVLGLGVRGILPAAVPPLFFGKPDKSVTAAESVRVAWMPRKNRALGRQVLQIASERLALETGKPGFEIVEIDNLSRQEVADRLSGAHIFLSSGFPEGFALPPLEAMAAGCVPVGFSGLGGFEYMRNPADSDLPGLCRPPFALPPLPWQANGLFVSDGDVLSAGLALARAVCLAAARHPLWDGLRAGARKTAEAYSLDERERQAARIWDELENQEHSPWRMSSVKHVK